MLNFNGIYQAALHGSTPGRLEEHVDGEAVAALRKELGDVVFPSECPWVGTDAWLWRFIERERDAALEP